MFNAAGSFDFNWYGFLIATGMLCCIVLGYFITKKKGFGTDLIFDIALIGIPLAIVGARLYYVVFDWIARPENWTFAKIFMTWEGGLAIYGGLIGGLIAAIILHYYYKKHPNKKGATFLQIVDLGFSLIILGQVIGRWGNFANQEAYGNLVTNPAWQFFPYAVQIAEKGGAWYQATFFYESMWNLVGFVILQCLYLGKKKNFDGFIFSVYCIFYGVGRFFIESLRADALWLIPNVIRVSQVVSIIAIIFGLSFILYHVYMARQNNMKPFLMVNESDLNEEYYGYETCLIARLRSMPVEITDYSEIEEASDEEYMAELDADELNAGEYDENGEINVGIEKDFLEDLSEIYDASDEEKI